MAVLHRAMAEDLPRLRQFWRERWAGDEMVVHGEIFVPAQLEGVVTEDWAGVVMYIIRAHECEIISLDSLRQGKGIGTALINAMVSEASLQGCRRICLTTTTDNMRELGFYQKCGFELVKIRRGAADESRKLKLAIPLIGKQGIPLRDEIELEMSLGGR